MTRKQQLILLAIAAGAVIIYLLLQSKAGQAALSSLSNPSGSGGGMAAQDLSVSPPTIQQMAPGLPQAAYTIDVQGCPCTSTTDNYFASSLQDLEKTYIARANNIQDNYLSHIEEALPGYAKSFVNNWSGALMSAQSSDTYLSL
jgi:hypothetical protein